MVKENITLKDIARIAGVSPATASLALSGDSRVNIKTKKNVEDVARRLKYVPNEIGRSLRARKAETVALIFPNTPHNAFSHPYFVELLEGITEVLIQNNFHLMLSTSPSEVDEEAAYDKIMRNRRADGIILWPTSINDPNIGRIVESGFPVVYLGKWYHDDIIAVRQDEIGGAYAATSHLVELGRKRIVHISGPLDHQVSIERLEGYRKALTDHKIWFDEELVTEKKFLMSCGAEAVNELTGRKILFDAIFAANDKMAIGAIKQLQALGLRVPEDIAVIGCDDIESAALITPSLSSINQQMSQIGMIAAEQMIRLLTKQKLTTMQTIVPSTLIIRESTGG